MKTIRNFLAPFLFVFLIASPILAIATPFPSNTAAIECEQRFLGIPPWYKGLTEVTNATGSEQCSIVAPDAGDSSDGLTKFITKIVLNVIEIALWLVGYIALFFVLLGGFQFLTGGSNPSQIEKARKSILNAVIGLVISFGAVAIVNLIFRILG